MGAVGLSQFCILQRNCGWYDSMMMFYRLKVEPSLQKRIFVVVRSMKEKSLRTLTTHSNQYWLGRRTRYNLQYRIIVVVRSHVQGNYSIEHTECYRTKQCISSNMISFILLQRVPNVSSRQYTRNEVPFTESTWRTWVSRQSPDSCKEPPARHTPKQPSWQSVHA